MVFGNLFFIPKIFFYTNATFKGLLLLLIESYGKAALLEDLKILKGKIKGIKKY